MREKEEVQERFNDLFTKRLKQRKARFLCQSHENCVWNRRLRVRKQGRVGFCSHPMVCAKCKAQVFVCNDAETAKKCKLFECRNTAESVEEDFERILRSPAQVGHEYPKLAILIWFLQEYKLKSRWSRLWHSVCESARTLVGLVLFRWW
jgi:hypothetical protein